MSCRKADLKVRLYAVVALAALALHVETGLHARLAAVNVEADLQVRLAAAQTSSSQSHGRLFPPTDLGLLETPDRAAWQKPQQIMDALKIADDSRVADIGAGAGWFTIHLARRVVGPNGRVYAQDIQQEMLLATGRRVTREGLTNVETRLGTEDDPNLPAGSLDAVLVVDSYQEVPEEDRVRFLRLLAVALKPGGRLGIVNYKPVPRGGPGPELRMESAAVEADARAAGLRVIDRADLPFQYLLVLGR